ncbi:AraC family transcriptional regulator [Clostridium sp. C2-6-12]|uniref:helix-turn-helix domain-containing protein n=1 Tax=Clostridium sp. C2-6-12 TaxID=2698832 RepID=UPI00136E88A9|nr:AraC family transcriptional regulator [Clostridium sp. C2-6-12]
MKKQLLDLLNLSSCIIFMDFEENSLIEELLFKILKEDKIKSTYSELYIMTLLLQLLITINRCSAKNKNDYETEQKNENILKIVRYLNSNYLNKISLNDLSELFFISEAHLSRSFKKVTGFNIITYINILRIKEAQKILLNSNMNITVITYTIGYESITNFERIF